MGETAAGPGHVLSVLEMFRHADIVVQSIMAGLVLASIACWALILEKSFCVWRLKREVGAIESAVASGAVPEKNLGSLAGAINAAAKAEWADGAHAAGSSDARDRLEYAMRAALKTELRRIDKGLAFLATLGSAAPFIGLFGTVWGIMNSFTAIAQSKDTSLAVVAPGIAEALFATAVGLGAAIPAVIAYNQFVVALGRASDQMSPAIASLARNMVRGSTKGASQ